MAKPQHSSCDGSIVTYHMKKTFWSLLEGISNQNNCQAM
jgi:hypothetical protein